VFETVDLTIDRVGDRIEQLPWDQVSRNRKHYHEFLKELSQDLPQIQNILLIDEDGKPRAQSAQLETPAHVTARGREYYVEHRANPDAKLRVGPTIIGRTTGTLHFGVSRARLRDDGAFGGVIYAAILPNYFLDVWREAAIGPEHAVALVRSDGTLLARYAEMPDQPFKISDESPYMRAIRDKDRGFAYLTSGYDSATRIVAFQKLQNYPVFISYGYNVDTILATWWRRVAIYGAVSLLAAVFLTTVILVAVRHMRAEQLALKELAIETQKRREVEVSRMHGQKLEAIGQITSSVAHDIANFVQAMSGCLKSLSGKQTNDALEKRVDLGLQIVDRTAKLSRQLLAFSRKQPVNPELIEVKQLIDEASPLIAQALGRNITFKKVLPSGTGFTSAETGQLETILLNLAINAKHAMPDGGTFTITTEVVVLTRESSVDGLSGEFIRITATDTGLGMTDEVVQRAFEPFFTTKADGSGTGLGLAAAYGYAKQSGGTAYVVSELGKGTSVVLLYPRIDPGSMTAPNKQTNVIKLNR